MTFTVCILNLIVHIIFEVESMINKVHEDRRKYQMDKEENEIIQHHDFVAFIICSLAIG